MFTSDFLLNVRIMICCRVRYRDLLIQSWIQIKIWIQDWIQAYLLIMTS